MTRIILEDVFPFTGILISLSFDIEAENPVNIYKEFSATYTERVPNDEIAM
jgi:hypothetical protein